MPSRARAGTVAGMTAEPCVIAAHDGHNRTAVRAAAALAGLLDAHLVIAEVYRHEPGRDTLNARRFVAAEAALAHVAEHLPAGTEEPERVTLPAARIAPALLATAREHDATLLVLGPDLRGHVAHEVLRDADFPVVVTPSDALLVVDPPRTIGVAFDGSVGSHFALAAARRLAERSGAALEVIGVAHRAHDRPALARALDEAVAPLDGAARAVLVDGPAGRGLRHESERLDLLCCGSRGRPDILGPVLGSVSSVLVADPPCPVLVVPPKARGREDRPLGLTSAGR